jgi:toxin HigB-1
MIRSFGDKRTEALFRDQFVRQFQGFARPAKRKLEALNAASRLEDLVVPPANRLERLKGDLKDFHSIRINDQWRVIGGLMASRMRFKSWTTIDGDDEWRRRSLLPSLQARC